jgi:cytochrome c oxidase subunit 3
MSILTNGTQTNSIKAGCKHPFHLVTMSPWPIFTAFGAFFLVLGTVGYLQHYARGGALALFGLAIVAASVAFWFRDIIVEGTYEGRHTLEVQRGLALGMILFIVSEVMFFFGFFWAFFHSALAPSIWIGNSWPPVGIVPLSPWGLALFNTVVLLSSGGALTWAHYSLKVQNRQESLMGLILTVGLGLIFTSAQVYEYYVVDFQISDGIFGSCFFLLTGFHGFHVIMGTFLLGVCAVRHYGHQFTVEHHFGFEAAAWYWHFVDVVWLFLYLFVYWWSAAGV